MESSNRGKNEYEYKITQINQEWQSKFSSFEMRVTQMNNENDELRRKLQEKGDLSRRI